MRFPTFRLMLLGFTAAASLVAAAPRTEIDLNSGWRFHLGEQPGAEQAGFNDSAWSKVAVPHTWNALDGQDGVRDPAAAKRAGLLAGDYARGTGWYRRGLMIDPALGGRRLYLQFDGANRRADVFVNGRLVGSHLGGHARFRFDVTGVAQPGRNLLAVRVNNEGNDIIPHSADFTFFGGLYRSVALLATDPVHIETMDHASPGVYLKQVAVDAQRANVEATVKLANHSTAPAELSVQLQVRDAAGTVVQRAAATAHLAVGERGAVRLPFEIASPRLWNGRADPYLYSTEVTVAVDGQVRDSIAQPLGLRFFRVDPQQGFFLNGAYLDLRGASRHQDRLDKGWAISADDDREDFALMMEMGCTAIRVAHYQQSPLWYELADRHGVVLWAEIPFVNEAVDSEVFFNNALEQMRELIRQNYNHPAIVFWGVGNETFDLGQSFAEGIAINGPRQERLIQALHALAKAEDPTRLTTYASFHSESDVNLSLPGQPAVHFKGEPQRFYTDTTAFNKYYGWYYGEASDNAVFFDRLHQRYPSQPLGVSEYGAGGSTLQHEPDRYGRDGTPPIPMESIRPRAFAKQHPEEYQAYYHEQTWAVLKERRYLWAKFIWNMFDFAVDWRNEGDTPGRNDKGMVTFDRKTRKDVFYFYKANWTQEPVLHLCSRRFTPRADSVIEVKVYSNAAEAELFVGDHSVGRRAVGPDRIVRWPDVQLAPGENRIRVAADFEGRRVTDECVWVHAPASVAAGALN